MIKACILIFVLIVFDFSQLTTAKHAEGFGESDPLQRKTEGNNGETQEFQDNIHRLRSLLRDPIDEEHGDLSSQSDSTHAHEWTLQIHSDDENAARELADIYGFDHVSKVEGVGSGVFRFSNFKRVLSKSVYTNSEEDNIEVEKNKKEINNSKDKREALLLELAERLGSDERIKWFKRERILEREKRVPPIGIEYGLFGDNLDDHVILSDTNFHDQWYIKNSGQTAGPAHFDSNIVPVWNLGYTGKGVSLSVLDDGMDHTHPDLVRNYDPEASKDLNGHDNDPFPNDSDPYNAHGTKCAGTIGAEGNNSLCGVGIAFNADVGAIRMLDGKATDALEADALSFHRDHIDIYSCSWGPKDNGKTFGRPGRLGRIAFLQGTKYGRQGLGSVFVWATGNGGRMTDDCNADGYVNSIYTIGIGSVNEHGVSVYYGEHCSAMFAVTYCSGRHSRNYFKKNPHADVITTYLHHQCTKHFVGTSSAAPLAAGIFALVLEANPKLTWRDLQHLLYHTTKVTSPVDRGWQKNGCGKLVNHKFGFGIIDAYRLVKAALNWTTVPKQRSCHFKLNFKNGDIPSRRHFKLNFTTDGCQSCKVKMADGKCKNGVKKLEHVVVNVTLKHRRRGDLRIELISPAGTVSVLLRSRSFDNSDAGLKGWKFLTVFNWCENPSGTWQLIFKDTNPHFNEKKRDFEEDYINYLDKEKKRVEEMKRAKEGAKVGWKDGGATMESDYPSVDAKVEKQVYDNGERFNRNNNAEEGANSSYEAGERSSNGINREKRAGALEKDSIDYDSEEEKRAQMVREAIKYEDEVLKRSLLAGEVLHIEVTFYGTG